MGGGAIVHTQSELRELPRRRFHLERQEQARATPAGFGSWL